MVVWLASTPSALNPECSLSLSASPNSSPTSLTTLPDRLLPVLSTARKRSHGFPQGKSWKYRLNGNHLPLGKSQQGSGDHLGGTFSWGCETVRWLVFFSELMRDLCHLEAVTTHPLLPLDSCLRSPNDNCLPLELCSLSKCGSSQRKRRLSETLGYGEWEEVGGRKGPGTALAFCTFFWWKLWTLQNSTQFWIL